MAGRKTAMRGSAPRMWRCFSWRAKLLRLYACLLHVCGGVSMDDDAAIWKAGVCSTYVEVFLEPCLSRICDPGLLHVCGGVS